MRVQIKLQMINCKFQMKELMKISLAITAFFVICNLCFVISVRAAEPRVYFERSGNFGLRVLIDSEAPVNAYDIEIAYNEAVAQIETFDTSKSVVTVLPQPISVRDGRIVIKGGSTQAFSGNGGELLALTLRPISEGILQMAVLRGTAYQADGAGTPLGLAGGQFALRVTPDSFAAYEQSRVVLAESLDSEPPKIATVSVEENPLNYGERLVVFTAFDQQSGVARYEARDLLWFRWSPWRPAVNPYPVTPGAWAIQLKAIDYSGNTSLATVYQFGNAIWKVGIALIVAIGALWFVLRRRRTTTPAA